MEDIDFSTLPTPCYVVDERLLRRNLEILDSVQRETGCRILLALKGFAMHAVFPLIGQTLAGVTASSLFEARLGREEMNREVHIYSPAYDEAEFDDILGLSDHIVLPLSHTGMLFAPAAAQQVEQFLRTGRFLR